jgi:hypothetical protein
MKNFEKYARIETSESITIMNEESEMFKLALNYEPFFEVTRRIKNNPETNVFYVRISNGFSDGEEASSEVSMDLTMDDAEFLHSAMTKILRRFKNNEIID